MVAMFDCQEAVNDQSHVNAGADLKAVIKSSPLSENWQNAGDSTHNYWISDT